MQPYPTIQNYANYQPYPQPYPDRLAQIQNQYQQAINIPQSQTQNQNINWVSGETGAKSWLVSPNSTVLLMDSENSTFYLKSADNSGMPLPLRIFDYKERCPNTLQNNLRGQFDNENDLDNKYVTREEYDGLKRQYEAIMERLDSINNNAEIEQNAKYKSKGRGGNSNEQSDI